MFDYQDLLSIQPFTWGALGTALLCATIIGLERQINGKPIGVRTSALIVLGTYIFMTSAIHVSNSMSDPSRIIGQVITGIGFLGAGVMLARDGLVLGVTSAATIWSLASLGVCISIGYHFSAIKLSIVVVTILVGVDWLESGSVALTRGAHQRYRGWRRRSAEEMKKQNIENPIPKSERTKAKKTGPLHKELE